MFQEFPYTNFHELNLDWIVKIAKDFLDQYTHIQEVIQTGLEDLTESRETGLAELDQKRLDSLAELNQKTLDGLADLQTKYDTLDGLLQSWYDTHSADIAGQLADAIADFNSAAESKSQALLDSWPDDYSALVTSYNELKIAIGLESHGVYTVPKSLFEQGTYTGGGLPIANENIIRTPVIIPVYPGCVINCESGTNVKAFNYVKWDSSKTRTGAGASYVSSLTLEVDWTGYVAFVCKRTVSGDPVALTPTDYDGTITITSYSKTILDKKLDKNGNIGYWQVLVHNKELQNILKDATKWNQGTLTKTENSLTFQSDGQNNGGGFRGANLTADKFMNGFLQIEIDVEDVSVNTFQLVLYAKKTNGGYYNHYVKFGIEEGYKKYIVDLNYMAIYEDFDGTQNFIVLIFNSGNTGTIELSKFSVFDYYNNQNTNMTSKVLEYDSAINRLNEEVAESKSEYTVTDYNGTHYVLSVNTGNLILVPQLPSNILFLGNSLLTGINSTSTGHAGITAFGMAASNMNEDYAARILTYLTNKGITPITVDKANCGGYEIATTVAEEETFLHNLFQSGYYLNDNRQLIIIQIGDNVNTTEQQELFIDSGADRFIAYIREHAKNARICWVAEWYSNTAKQEAIRNACKKYGAVFVDISDLFAVSGNQSYIGAEIELSDGDTWTITQAGQASHPSSDGFEAIANRIITNLFE